MPDSEPYNDILFDKNTDALCALIICHIKKKISRELITDDHATLVASDFSSHIKFFISFKFSFLRISVEIKERHVIIYSNFYHRFLSFFKYLIFF